MDSEKLLDDVGRRILKELQDNPRIPHTELGRRVGLTQPGVTERIRRMEEAGIILGYRVDLDLEKIGLPIVAFILVATPDEGRGAQLMSLARSMPEVLECHRVTGDESYILKVALASVQRLEKFLTRLAPLGQPTTYIVLSSPITHKPVDPSRPGSSSGVPMREESHLIR